jgi:hypothetical protein
LGEAKKFVDDIYEKGEKRKKKQMRRKRKRKEKRKEIP